MRVIERSGRASGVAAEPPAEVPPPWWAVAWARRQRRCRANVLRRMPAGAWLSTEQVYQLVTTFEKAEVEYALADLGGAGLLDVERRAERVSASDSRAVERTYWRPRPDGPAA